MGRNGVVSGLAFALVTAEVSVAGDFDLPQAIAQARSAAAKRLREGICVILSNGVGSIETISGEGIREASTINSQAALLTYASIAQ
jgi:hypothetical protein